MDSIERPDGEKTDRYGLTGTPFSIPRNKAEALLWWPSLRPRPKHIVNKCPVNALWVQAYFPAHSPHQITGSRCKFPWWHGPWEVDCCSDIWNKVLQPKNAWLWLKISLAYQIRDNPVSLPSQPYLWVWQVSSDASILLTVTPVWTQSDCTFWILNLIYSMLQWKKESWSLSARTLSITFS